MKKMTKRPKCPSVDRISCKIADCKRKGEREFCVPIPDNEIDITKKYFSTLNIKIDLEYQSEGIFFYKVYNYE